MGLHSLPSSQLLITSRELQTQTPRCKSGCWSFRVHVQQKAPERHAVVTQGPGMWPVPQHYCLWRLHFGCEESGEGKKKHRAVCCWVPRPCFPSRYGRGSRALPTPSRPGGESFPHACLPGSFSFPQAGGDTNQSILEAYAALVPGG